MVLSASREVTDEAAERSAPLGGDERVDPNRADEVQLDRLPGVGPATARSILQARDTGLVFRRVDDLLIVRGIGPALLSQITPYLDLSTAGRSRPGRRTRSPPAPTELVNINRADLAELQILPGVGPAIATRIIEERGKQMFRTVDDLLRVRGLGPATVQRLRSLVTVRSAR